MENFCQRHNITSFKSFCAICLSVSAVQLPEVIKSINMNHIKHREQDVGHNIMMDIEEVDLANILDFVSLIINNTFTSRIYQPMRLSRR